MVYVEEPYKYSTTTSDILRLFYDSLTGRTGVCRILGPCILFQREILMEMEMGEKRLL